MAINNQSNGLPQQLNVTQDVIETSENEAKSQDFTAGEISHKVYHQLALEYLNLEFRHRRSIEKKEINLALKKVDLELGQTLFVDSSTIVPDGGIIEVKDDNGNWRVILISEAKSQGKDIDNIKKGKLVGAKADQDFLSASTSIERLHKNICEMANYMLAESYFPYVVFLEGTNFLTETIKVARPDGRVVTLEHNSGVLNRLDRLTAANYGLPMNTNLCKNKYYTQGDKVIMLQAISIYTQGKGDKWDGDAMFDVMMETARTSLQVLGSDLFKQLTNNNEQH